MTPRTGRATYCAGVDLAALIEDLIAEQDALDEIVGAIGSDEWARPTPSQRWSVADQIGHLTFFDGTAALAIIDPEAFVDHRDALLATFTDPLAVDDHTLAEFRGLRPAEQLAAWRANRAALASAARTLSDGDRVEWYGPSMSAKSFITARLMEVWAHGQDVVDALQAERSDTDRLVHVAQLGYITRGWSYAVRGEPAPDAPVRVSLTAPSGAVWTWGPSDAVESVSGPAGDFCRVVTQRRHVADTELVVVGAAALDWMHKAQAFAGAPTRGPARRS